MRARYRLLVLGLSCLLMVLSVGRAYALRQYVTTIYYYDDAQHTNLVGEGFVDCHWHYSQIWGDQTDYTSENNEYLCGGGGEGPYCNENAPCSPPWVCVNGWCTL